MKLPENLTPEIVQDACARRMVGLDNPGFCINCGIEQGGCEPDAREYLCEACGLPTVYGAEEILLVWPWPD
jgi:hypothetical protein